MSAPTHTPTPWRVDPFAKHGNLFVIQGDQEADGWTRIALAYSETDAALIVKAVNACKALLARIAPTSAEFEALADEYQAGLEKCVASGYEEYGVDFQRRQRMVITALRAASSLRL